MRKLGLIIAFWIGLLAYPLSSLALGLGEIEVESYLNQPLKAKIPVVSARPGEIDDLLVSLAGRDAFRKAGLERPSVLSQLRFKLSTDGGTNAHILVTTRQPVKEPFLNFLVEADWTKGRLLREYTILLDPPVFAQQPAAVTQPRNVQQLVDQLNRLPTAETRAPIAQAEQAPAPQPALAGEPVEDLAYVPESAVPPANESLAGQTIKVEKGDTLWGIASRLKDGEHSMAQIMIALQQANPDAFGQGNINNLKVGAILRIPDPQAINDLSKQEAYARVLEQNGLWDEYLARVRGEPSFAEPQGEPAAATAAQESGTADGGQLSLLAPGEGKSDSTGMSEEANAADVDRIRKQLALAEEELEATRLENTNLQSRVRDLEAQLKKFEELQQKLMQVEDPALARLQQNEAGKADNAVTAEVTQEAPTEENTVVEDRLAEEMATVTGAPMDSMTETPPAEDGMLSEPVGDQAMAETGMDQPVADVTVMEPDTVANDAGGDGGMMSEAPAGEDQTDVTPEETPLPKDEAMAPEGEAAPAEQIPPSPVIVTEAPQDDGGLMGMLPAGIKDMLPTLGGFLKDPVMLGGIGAILALLAGLLFVRRRKSSDNEEDAGIILDIPDKAVEDDMTPVRTPDADAALRTEEIESTQIDTPSDESFTERTLEETATDLGTGTEEYSAEELLEEISLDEDDAAFEKTAVLSADEMPQAEAVEEQDDVLNEVDVYLAYGLYDNAEDLLKSSLDEHPTRADYRAKLLDTYYATKNRDAFIDEAQKLRSLGGAADRFWDRVQVMGHELAPDEELFQGAENIDPEEVKIEYEKPQTADFDLGAEADMTDFTADFDLGEENEDIADTLVVPEVPEEAEDKSPEVDLSLDGDQGPSDEDALSFELPDEMGQEVEELEELSLDETREAPIPDEVPPLGDGDLELLLDDDATDLGPEIESNRPEEQLPESLDVDAESETAGKAPADEAGSAADEDITEFRPADLTGEFEVPETAEEIESSVIDDKTGTFAPGDFGDDLTVDPVDEIEGLMLPDDVDEVATKLDLAKAFIDMGDAEGARSSLQEVLEEGDDNQKAEAADLLNQIK